MGRACSDADPVLKSKSSPDFAEEETGREPATCEKRAAKSEFTTCLTREALPVNAEWRRIEDVPEH